MIRFGLFAALWSVGAVPALAGKYNAVLDVGDKAPSWTDLKGVDGKRHALSDFEGKDVVVVVFTCNSCPVATDYEDRIIAFSKKFCGAGGRVGLVAINVNRLAEDRLPKMKERALSKVFDFPYLYDETQKIGKAFGANFTPEFFVLDRQRQVVYMGGMDDNSQAAEVKKNHLEPAVEAALAGKRPTTAEAPAIGCRVRYARERGER
jgi:peroxiredoxin